MNYSERYIKRLKDKGSNSRDATINHSKRMANKQFNTSPSYAIVKVGEIDTDSIVNHATKYNEKLIFFRPDTLINIGSLIEYKNKNYLLVTFLDDELYPKGDMVLCNSTFPIETDKTSLLMTDEDGNPVLNKFGDEVFIDVDGSIEHEPCVVETTYFNKDNNVQLPLPQGTMKIKLKYQKASNIKINYEFKMYDETYKIEHVDFSKVINGYGIMIINAKKDGG